MKQFTTIPIILSILAKNGLQKLAMRTIFGTHPQLENRKMVTHGINNCGWKSDKLDLRKDCRLFIDFLQSPPNAHLEKFGFFILLMQLLVFY